MPSGSSIASTRRSAWPLAAVVAFAALTGGAQAQSESVVENVRLGTGAMSYEAPRVIVRGSRLSKDELARLLDSAANEPWSARIMRLEADEILAPELIARIKTAQIDQRTVYRDVLLKRVGGGKVASVTSSGGTMEGSQAGNKVTGTNGAMSIDDLDIGASLALVDGKAAPTEPLKRIYGGFSMDGLKVVDSSGITTQIGRMSGKDFAAKPTSAGWMETINTLAAAEKDKGPLAVRRAMDAVAELVDSLSVGTVEVADISMKGRVEKDDTDLDFFLKRVSYAGAAAGRPGEARIEGANFEGGGARISYGLMSYGGIDMKPALDALREFALNPDDPSPAVLRKLLPIMSSVRLENLEVDMPEGGSKGSNAVGAPRTKFGLGRFEIASEKPINGIPTLLRIVMRNMTMPIPANSDKDGFDTLAQLGYDKLDGSAGIDLGWNEPGQEIVIRDISLDAKDMGTASIRGVVGKIGRDVFNMDTAVASVALISAAAKSLDITVDNRGLFERIVARESKRQKRPAEDIRREYGMAASVGIPAILGNGPAAKNLAQAVGRFVAKPGKLTIQAKAKGQGGYGIADYMANPSPAGVLEALDITATAE